MQPIMNYRCERLAVYYYRPFNLDANYHYRYAAIYAQNHQAGVQAQSTSITVSMQSEPIPLLDPSDAALFAKSIERL